MPKSQTEVTNGDMASEQKADTTKVNLSLNNPSSGEESIAGGAMSKYDKQDYAGAIPDFETTLKKNPNDEQALYYSAVSYMSIGQPDKAITNLNKILQNKN